MEFKYVSLFSGIGGFEQALNPLGGECVMSSEIDAFANKSYEILYGHKTEGDVTKIAAQDVPDHDLLVGGFPCQAFSVAGKRLGFDDTRGTLFFEIARIAKEKQPKAILLENVKGLISHDKGKTLDTIVQTLNDIGYTVDFEVLNSKFYVPQNRERIFIIALRNDLVLKPRWNTWNMEGRNDVVAKGKKRIKSLDVEAFNFKWPEQTEVTMRLRDILEPEVEEKFYLSEDKTANLVAKLPTPEMNDGSNVSYCLDANYAKGTAPGDMGKGRRTHVLEPQMIGHVDIKGHDAIKRVYSPEGVSPTLTTMGGGHREPKISVIGHTGTGQLRGRVYNEEGLSPTISATDYKDATKVAQGLPIREATKAGYAIATEGDAVNFQFPESKTRRGRVGKQIAQTLEASSINQGIVTPEYRIRKLTPKECFRLQGFSDEVFDKLQAGGISNSQLYKQAGNAVTVNVIEAIAKNLLPYLKN
jgi:DNA (cytosine-5)-methyltransferase 1